MQWTETKLLIGATPIIGDIQTEKNLVIVGFIFSHVSGLVRGHDVWKECLRQETSAGGYFFHSLARLGQAIVQ